MANQMFTDATMRAQGLAAGMPANFFFMNPAMNGGSFVTGRPEDALASNYDALQFELRRRLSGGLLLQGSYQYILRQDTTNYVTVRTGPEFVSQSSPLHALKLNWSYELPFGRGQHFGSGVGKGLNYVIGGWSFDGNARIQSGNIIDFGNVRLVGMTDADLQGMYKQYIIPDATNPAISRVFMLPQAVIANSMLAFSTSATSPTGYSGAAPTGAYFAPIQSGGCLQVYRGTCEVNGQITSGPADHHYVTGPMFSRFDVALGKRFDITRSVNGELRIEALNVFKTIDFRGVALPSAANSTTLNNYQVTSAYRDSSDTQDPGGRLLQVSWRFTF